MRQSEEPEVTWYVTQNAQWIIQQSEAEFLLARGNSSWLRVWVSSTHLPQPFETGRRHFSCTQTSPEHRKHMTGGWLQETQMWFGGFVGFFFPIIFNFDFSIYCIGGSIVGLGLISGQYNSCFALWLSLPFNSLPATLYYRNLLVDGHVGFCTRTKL